MLGSWLCSQQVLPAPVQGKRQPRLYCTLNMYIFTQSVESHFSFKSGGHVTVIDINSQCTARMLTDCELLLSIVTML